MKKMKVAKSVDEYIANHPAPIAKNLKKIRSIIKKVAPKVTEKIGYGMPAYAYDGVLIYFAAYSKHIGIYAMPSAVEKFAKQLANYETSKGTIRLPLEEPIPEKLITAIVKFRMKENIAKKKGKKNQPKIFR